MPITSSVMQVVAKAAPLLGAVLGTPAAGVGMKLVLDALGVGDGDDAALETALAAPEAAAKLREVELQHAEVLARIASTDYAVEVEDRKDARAHAAGYGNFVIWMAYVVTAMFAMTLVMVFLPLPMDGMDRDLLSMLIGMLVSKWQTIIDFFYGSKSNTGSDKNGK